MSVYMPQQQLKFPETHYPSMEWEFDEEESPDVGAFPQEFCATSGQRLAPCTSVAGDASGINGDPATSISLTQSPPNSHHPTFPQVLSTSAAQLGPFHHGRLLQSHFDPAQTSQLPAVHGFGGVFEVTTIYQGPSPVSEYSNNSPIKLDQDVGFPHIHHPAPAYLPPNSFMLSPPSVQEDNPFQSPLDSPLASADPPIKLEEDQGEEEAEFTDQDKESFSLPLPTPQSPFLGPPQSTADGGGGGGGGGGGYMMPHGQRGMMVHSQQSMRPAVDDDQDEIDRDKTAPYAVLIHRALMSTPDRKMVLSQIYEYFREKIPRFRKVKGRGWMNSIRHNLSMNGAFLKEDRPPEDPGKGFIWVLSEEAAREGVKSTTRYRKSPPNPKRRATDDLHVRRNNARRRRKSTRKWSSTKSRSSSLSHALQRREAEDEEAEAEEEEEEEAEKSQRHCEQRQRQRQRPTPDDSPPPPPPPPLHMGEISAREPLPVHIPIAAPVQRVDHMMVDGGCVYADECGGTLTAPTMTTVVVPCAHGSLGCLDFYASFPHSVASQTIYDGDTEGLGGECWHLCGSGDRFSEEFTLVTQE